MVHDDCKGFPVSDEHRRGECKVSKELGRGGRYCIHQPRLVNHASVGDSPRPCTGRATRGDQQQPLQRPLGFRHQHATSQRGELVQPLPRVKKAARQSAASPGAAHARRGLGGHQIDEEPTRGCFQSPLPLRPEALQRGHLQAPSDTHDPACEGGQHGGKVTVEQSVAAVARTGRKPPNVQAVVEIVRAGHQPRRDSCDDELEVRGE
mmetsp:Transcript_1196/g.2636  ORF Transcript_1196/g.2636 Transcript_1196/m.2636 type:complete len:207 (-) Transcript_1196:86-706(-)